MDVDVSHNVPLIDFFKSANYYNFTELMGLNPVSLVLRREDTEEMSKKDMVEW